MKADLARKQTECAGLETQAEDLADQVRQLGLTMETARAASTQRDQHQGILLRDAEERAEIATTELHQLQSARSSYSPDQQRMEEILMQNTDLQEQTGELMARVEDMDATHTELRAMNEIVEEQAKLMKCDLETYTMYSPLK